MTEDKHCDVVGCGCMQDTDYKEHRVCGHHYHALRVGDMKEDEVEFK